jgi:hypothetical protein
MNRHFNERVARHAELAVRLVALLCATLGGPCFAIAAAATGRPLLGLGAIAASGPLAVVRLIPPPRQPIRPESRELHFATAVAHDWEMDNFESLLLYELRAIQLSPDDLQTVLKNWNHEISTTEIVATLRRLQKEGLVDGPGISLIHNLPVWLTQSGQTRARKLGTDLGGWRQVA